MKYIEEVGEKEKVCSGWDRVFYKIGKAEILLSEIRPNTPFKVHKHEEIQFGFCFKGTFSFIVDNAIYEIHQGSGYLLNSSIPHRAEASVKFCALDLKMLLSDYMSEKIELFDVIQERNGEKHYDFGQYMVSCLKFNEKTGNVPVQLKEEAPFLIVSETTNVEIEGELLEVKPMHLYRIKKGIRRMNMPSNVNVVLIYLK